MGCSPWGCKESDMTKQFHLVHAVLATGLHSYTSSKLSDVSKLVKMYVAADKVVEDCLS